MRVLHCCAFTADGWCPGGWAQEEPPASRPGILHKLELEEELDDSVLATHLYCSSFAPWKARTNWPSSRPGPFRHIY